MGILHRGIALLRMREVADTMRSVERLKEWVRGQGLGYANELLHRDASNAFYRARAETIQGGLNLDAPLRPGQYLRGSWQRPESYHFVGEATWYDPVNDRPVIRSFSVYSQFDTNSDAIAALWTPSHEEYLSETGLQLLSVDFKEKWHKISAPYRTSLEI